MRVKGSLLLDHRNRPKSILIDTLYHEEFMLSAPTQMHHITCCILWIYEKFERRHVDHLWFLSFYDGGTLIGTDSEGHEHEFAKVSSVRRLKMRVLQKALEGIFLNIPWGPETFIWRYDFGHMWDPDDVARVVPGSETPDYESADSSDTEVLIG